MDDPFADPGNPGVTVKPPKPRNPCPAPPPQTGDGAGRAMARRRPVQAAGKGDADPLAPNTTPANTTPANTTPEGREPNRRTEIVLLKTARLP